MKKLIKSFKTLILIISSSVLIGGTITLYGASLIDTGAGRTSVQWNMLEGLAVALSMPGYLFATFLPVEALSSPIGYFICGGGLLGGLILLILKVLSYFLIQKR